MNENLINCQNCGAGNLSTQDVCQNCGAKLNKPEPKKKKERKIKINFLELLKFIVAIISFVLFVFGILNIPKLISDGVGVFGSGSVKVTLCCIVQCIAPFMLLVSGILTLVKRKETKKSSNVLLLILYLVSGLLYIIPLLLISDVIYMILGVTKFSPASIGGVLSVDFVLFYLANIILSLKPFSKKALKIIGIIVFAAILVVAFILLINGLQPSEFLLPDSE